MRTLFETLLIHEGIIDTGIIWDKFASNFGDDLSY